MCLRTRYPKRRLALQSTKSLASSMKSVKMLESDEDEEEEGNKKETKGMNGDIEKGNSRDEPRKLF